jgi:hypothetical protein
MLQAGVNLIRPDWVWLRSLFRVTNDLAWITILLLVLRAGNWIVLADIPGSSAESYRRTVNILNPCFRYALIGLVVVTAYSLFHDVRCALRGPQTRTSTTTQD